jgi:hypothetical protein
VAYCRTWQDSIVDDACGGTLQSTITCQRCQHASHCFDPVRQGPTSAPPDYGVTQRARSVTQRALSVTQRARSVTQRALSVSPSELSASPSELSASPRELLPSPSELLACHPASS